MRTERTHVLVVGAGSAGCVVAARLSEDPTVDVVLLEAGVPSRNPWLTIPIGYFRTMGDARFDWKFETEPEPELMNRRVPWPRGKGVGGSSLINGMLYLRGHAQDYDQWAALGNAGWGWDAVLPYFKKSMHRVRGASPTDGTGGPLWVSEIDHDAVSDAFIRSAGQCGIGEVDDFNRGDNSGAGYFQMTMRRGRRASSARAFLHPARRRSNLRVVSDASATRVLFDRQRAVGVEALVAGQPMRFHADREVVLCAGALQTPHLLQLSGIGPGDVLQRCGIEVIADLPGVGRNLQDHLQVRPTFRLDGVKTLNQVANSRLHGGVEAARYLFTRRGALTFALHRAGAFFSACSPDDWPDTQIHLALLSLEERNQPPHPFPGITMSGCHLRPTSRGRVEVVSADPAVRPAIRANYLATEHDRLQAIAMTKRIREIARADAFRKLIVDEIEPGRAVRSDEQILDWVRRRASSIFHPAGTCAMGPGTDADAVVDDRLRVHGTDALRVVDASIMPRVVSGNTNAPVMMIAEKGADLIRAS